MKAVSFRPVAAVLWLSAACASSAMAEHAATAEHPATALHSPAALNSPGLDLAAAEVPLGLPQLPQGDAPPGLARLGERLFFDPRLSATGTLSCAGCHDPSQAFTQNVARPKGVQGSTLRRNTPSLYNVAYRSTLFFDGRVDSLEQQVWSPLLALGEMGNPTRQSVIQRLAAIPEYAQAFGSFSAGVSGATLAAALAAYQRTLLAADSPFDRWFFAGDASALGAAAKRGFQQFVEHECVSCHTLTNAHAHFTDDAFHDTGAAAGLADLGRADATGVSADRWRFRTPSVRNVALTAPYLHDGSLPTLAAVVDFYARGGKVRRESVDPRIRPFEMAAGERADLVEFLRALTSSALVRGL